MYQINDPPGQKYSRNIRLKRFVLLLISSYPKTCFIVHRTRKSLGQLTAAAVNLRILLQIQQIKKQTGQNVRSVFLAPPVGLEPTTLRLTAACSAN